MSQSDGSSFFDPEWFVPDDLEAAVDQRDREAAEGAASTRRDRAIANEIFLFSRVPVVDLSGGKPPDHFANQEDLRKAAEMERRLVNLLERAKSLSHSLQKVYAGAVPTPSNWQPAQDAITAADRTITEAAYRARQLRSTRVKGPGR